VSFVQPAHAIKPPKELCLDFDSFGDYQMLAIKKVGKVHGATANTTMYNIAGDWYGGFHNPVAGTGYVVPGTTTFHASVIGVGNGINSSHSGTELVYDLTTDTGTIYYHYQFASGTSFAGSDTVTGVDCSAFDPAISNGNYTSGKDK
jgi:hypothetical protein